MYDDNRDALAAEYVLGTLAADEREQAEALLAIDPGFAEIVRVWERRLGELNVMVEAVEPPPEVWDKIQNEIGIAMPGPSATDVEPLLPLAGAVSPNAPPEAPTVPAPEPALNRAADIFSDAPRDLDELAPPIDLDEPIHDPEDTSAVTALASALSAPEPPPPVTAKRPPPEPPAALPPNPVDRNGAVVRLQRGVRRWRGMTVAMSAIAALLAVFIGITQFAPGLIPLGRLAQPAVIAARPQPPGTRLTAVLQQEPTEPAFLLTVDPQSRTLTVRTVSASPEAGRSYELWLIAGKNTPPRSLGTVGGEQFTTRPIPSNFDIDTVRTASYAVSLEPAGGSPTGVPTGPILFTGKMVESVPGSAS